MDNMKTVRKPLPKWEMVILHFLCTKRGKIMAIAVCFIAAETFRDGLGGWSHFTAGMFASRVMDSFLDVFTDRIMPPSLDGQ